MELKQAASLPDDGYGLTRTYASSTRLNLQHYLWRDTLGYNIHPSIPIPENGKGIRIADVGTGTFIWPIDVSCQYPWAQLDGFDISLDQCPPKEWLPKNTSIRKLDVFSRLPEDLVGRYDIINVRLFVCVVKENDPVPILKNLLKMLSQFVSSTRALRLIRELEWYKPPSDRLTPTEPGGYLQWCEHNLSTTTIAYAGSERPDSAMRKLNQMLLDAGAGSWVLRLSETFVEQGFFGVRLEQYPVKPYFRSFFTQMTCMSVEEYTFAVLDNSSLNASGPQCRRLVREASQELKEGFALNYILEAIIGRKPAL